MTGYFWNSPNTLIGLLWGGGGMAYDYTFGQGKMSVGVGNNAIEFYNHPGMILGAITLGNTIHYPEGAGPNFEFPEGIKLGEHEGAHTIQGEVLGPLYLPAHVTTMVISIIISKDTHKSNLLEKGPNSKPATPW